MRPPRGWLLSAVAPCLLLLLMLVLVLLLRIWCLSSCAVREARGRSSARPLLLLPGCVCVRASSCVQA